MTCCVKIYVAVIMSISGGVLEDILGSNPSCQQVFFSFVDDLVAKSEI